MIKIILLLLIHALFCLEASNTEKQDLRKIFGDLNIGSPINCPYPSNNTFLPQPKECCTNLTNYFNGLIRSPYLIKFSFTRYFYLLESWNCTEELELMCKDDIFKNTDFTNAIRKKFCSRSQFETECLERVGQLPFKSSNWNELVKYVSSNELTNEQLMDSCIQAAVYDSTEEGKFVESGVVNFMICSIAWHGFDLSIVENMHLTVWNVLTNRLVFQNISVFFLETQLKNFFLLQ